MTLSNFHIEYLNEVGEQDLLYFDIGKEKQCKTFEIKSNITKGKLTVDILPKQPFTVLSCSLELEYHFTKTDKIFCNGFQSWTDSKYYSVEDKVRRYKGIISKWTKAYGDHLYYDYPQKKGYLHSWGYGFVKNDNGGIAFIGSKTEEQGFTLIEYKCQENKIVISKDCKGVLIDKPWQPFNLLIETGKEQEVWNKYAPTKPSPKLFGYTSWYYHYNKINPKILEDNIDAFEKNGVDIDIFQTDDGWQQAIGDWQSCNGKFLNGLKPLVDKIHNSNTKAGLWLAPFVCEKNSNLFRNNKDWLLKDEKGKPVKAGHNPLWSGTFYALDIYNEEYRAYLKQVFNTVLHDWAFDMVKLDFLYAVCLLPRKNKTRGQVMTEAMQFLRECCEDKLMLGCGVPLLPANVCDYCRIGPDVGLSWDTKLLEWLGMRERISTKQAIINTLNRWQQNQKWFGNDPDVFILRGKKNKLSEAQQKVLFFVNTLFGNLVFTSDNINEYDEATLALYKSQKQYANAEILSVEQNEGIYEVMFKNKGKTNTAVVDLEKFELETKAT